MSTISAKEMDKKLDQKKNRKERNKEKLETSTKIQQTCTTCSQSFSSKEKLKNHMIKVHDLLRSEVEKVSREFKCTRAPLCSKTFNKRKHLNRHIEKYHEDSKSDNNKSVGRNTVANEESHVENHRFGAKQNLPFKNQNLQGPQQQTNQRFDPGLLGGIMPPRFGPPPGFPPSFDTSQPPPGMGGPGMRMPGFPPQGHPGGHPQGPPGGPGGPGGPPNILPNVEGQGDVEMEIEDQDGGPRQSPRRGGPPGGPDGRGGPPGGPDDRDRNSRRDSRGRGGFRDGPPGGPDSDRGVSIFFFNKYIKIYS